MLTIDYSITPEGLGTELAKMFELAGQKILSIEKSWDPSRGTPVFTVKGTYTSRGWTEWTQGFQFGCAILQFDGTDEKTFLELGRHRPPRLATLNTPHHPLAKVIRCRLAHDPPPIKVNHASLTVKSTLSALDSK